MKMTTRDGNEPSRAQACQSSSSARLYFRKLELELGSFRALKLTQRKGGDYCYTQSPGGSSDTSEGSENSGSFKDSGRSDEEDSKYKASSEEGGFETLQLQRSTKESRAPVMYSPSASYLLLTENGEPESYSESLSSKEFVQWNKAINEEMVSLKRTRTWAIVILVMQEKKALQTIK
ncbi:hypothetical protein Tco_1048734 [Tanacetum coccineum]